LKTLVIGMDGAGIETFKRGWTPYIESLIEKGYRLDLKEDLLSRGWVEIFTGKHAIETGALYDRPLLNRSLDWTTKFDIEKIPGWGREIKPIWQVLNKRGYKVGIMNIPTTFPAPKVNGFFVSGGGGGARVVQEATEELCYPKDIVKYLRSIGYIVDERMPDLFKKNLLTADEVFSRFQIKNQKRTEAFIQLSKEQEVDFGFVVYKTSSVMAEFFTIPELEKELKGDKFLDKNLLKMSKKYYQEFDRQIKTLVESFDDVAVILVSDHSEAKSCFEVNLNCFLQNNGFQTRQQKSVNQSVQYLRDLVKHNIPSIFWKRIRNIKKAIPNGENNQLLSDRYFLFNPKKSAAFCVPCGDWCRGIYINDEDRFNGIVAQNNIIDLSHEISDRINNDKTAKEHGITSHVKPRFDTSVSKYFPDVVVDIPDGYIVSRHNAKAFVTDLEGIKVKKTNFDTIEKWAETDGISLTVRGYHPIAVSSCPWTEEISPTSNDLTMIYRHLLRQF
jgi:predicted AlkP superfamily phosphohydrolase/phosphomutase